MSEILAQNVIHFPRRQRAVRRPDKIAALPFVTVRKGAHRRCFWSVRATGKMRDLEKEQRLGREYALLALDAAAADEFTPLLGMIVYDMMRRPRTQQVITGFMQTISEHAVAHYAELNRGAS
jgi:hypothetical protein